MCDCISKANAALLEHNNAIDTRKYINMKTGKMSEAILIPTRKINQRIRKPMKILFVNFCPLCGEKRSKP